MRIHARAYAGPDDQPTMAALAHTHPAENLHRVDLPYRFSSWALDEPENARLWFDDAGRLVAWAALQTPFGRWTMRSTRPCRSYMRRS